MRQIPLRRPTIAVLLSLLAAAAAAGPGRVPPPADRPELAKLSGHLLRVRELALAGRSADEIAEAVPAARLAGDLTAVQVSLERLTPAILARLQGAGLTVDSFDLDHALAYGRVDPAGLQKIAAVPEVSTVHPMPRRGTRAGSVPSQADASLNADDVRTSLGVDGTGVDVGILSDSFNRTTLGGSVSGGVCTCSTPGSTCAKVVTGMTNQGTGDLPAGIPILDDCTAGSPNCDVLSDEGAAIAELIFDLAPEAGFLFHSAFNSPSDFAGGIAQLVNCGADLIVDDVFYTLQPFFQDGVIAQAAQDAFDAGVPYFSAAGNDATFGIHDVYTDSNPAAADNELGTPNGDDLHDFDPGAGVDSYAAITLPDDCSIDAELQWSEPFDGELGPGASSDLDLYLLSSAEPPATAANELVASTTFTGCGAPPFGECADGECGDPVETVTYKNETGETETVFLAIEHVCGDEGVDLRVVNISFDCNFLAAPWSFESSIFVDAQIFGHPAARDVVAVGAAFYGEIDSGGTLDPPTDQLNVEPFSSRGGTLPFYFDGDGDPLPSLAAAAGLVTRDGPPPPETRFKPDITSIDGTNTTFFGCPDPGGAPCVEGDGFPNFFGTSAAAPHATALAVLIWQLTGELISPRALHQLIEQAVLEMELPGQDDLSGTGLTDGLLAARSLSTTPLLDDLEFHLDGEPFLTGVPGSLQPLQAKDTLTLGDGDFSGLEGIADQVIFADGFESGDTSAWGN